MRAASATLRARHRRQLALEAPQDLPCDRKLRSSPAGLVCDAATGQICIDVVLSPVRRLVPRRPQRHRSVVCSSQWKVPPMTIPAVGPSTDLPIPKARHSAPSIILIDKVADWLMERAIAGTDLESVVRGFCNRLAATGLPLARIHLSFSMLHPL